MRIYPAIDLKNGKCVRLCQGRFEDVTVYGQDLLAVAKKWEQSGAGFLHVVDLDGARGEQSENEKAIGEIAAALSIPVQTGGGIRTLEDIARKLSLGVSRVILGTVAIKEPSIVKEAVEKFGKKIAVGIDAKDGMVAVSGWEEVSGVSALSLCKQMAQYGVETIIYTDISKDGMLCGPNVEATKEIAVCSGVDVIASGGISSMADLERLQMAGIHGAIIGKALYQGALDLKEVILKFEKV